MTSAMSLYQQQRFTKHEIVLYCIVVTITHCIISHIMLYIPVLLFIHSLTGQLKNTSFMAGSRLRHFVVEVVHGGNTRPCASISAPLKKSERRRIGCPLGTKGNIVKVRQTSKDPQILTLCEVEVYGIAGT